MNYNLSISITEKANPGESRPEQSSGLHDVSRTLGRWQHDHPHFEHWQITKVRGNNVYDIKLADTGATHSKVRAISDTPTNFQVEDTVTVGFYDINRREPYILAQGILEAEPSRSLYEAIFSQWACDFANFQRSNSWTDDDPFVLDSIVQATFPTGGKFFLFLNDYRFGYSELTGNAYVPTDPASPTHFPHEEWSLTGSDVADTLGITSGDYGSWYDSQNGDPDEGYTRSHEVYSSTVLSDCIVGDLVYLELLCQVDTYLTPDGGDPSYEDSTDRTILIALGANPQDHGYALEMVWGIELGFDIMEGGERMSNTDIIFAAGRAVIFFEGPSCFHVDALTGGDLREIDISSYGEANGNDTLNDCISGRYLKTLSLPGNDPRVFVGGGYVNLICINVETDTVVWERTDAHTTMSVSGLASTYDGLSLMTFFEEEEYTTVTDMVLDIGTETVPGGEPGWYDWPANPTPNPVDRAPTLAEGHSVRAGKRAINLDTGATVGEDVFTEVEDNGFVAAPYTDYYRDISLPVFVDYPSVENPNYPATSSVSHYPYSQVSNWWAYRAAAIRELFSGPTPPPYNNVTGTWVESGSSGPTVTGLFEHWSDGGNTAEKLSGYYDTYSAPDDRDSIDPDAYDLLWNWDFRAYLGQRSTPDPFGASDQVPGNQLAMAQVELGRANNGDWIVAEGWLGQKDNVAIFDTSSYEIPNPNDSSLTPIAGSSTFHVGTEMYRSRRRQGLSYGPGSGYNYLESVRPFFYAEPIPNDGIKPDHGSRKCYDHLGTGTGLPTRISQEYDAANQAWDGMGDRPYTGEATFQFASPGPTTAGVFSAKWRIIWRSYQASLPRYKSVAPLLTLGGTCCTGKYEVSGPRFVSGEGLHWRAYNGFCARVWEAELDKPDAVPAIPICVKVSLDGEEKLGVITPYYWGAQYWLHVIDADTGLEIYDEAMPAEITSELLESYYGDRSIWSINPDSYMALAAGA